MPTERNSGRGSAQRLLMGDLSAEDIGRRAENAPTLNAQVRLRLLLHLINFKGNLVVYFSFSIFLSMGYPNRKKDKYILAVGQF